MLYNIEGPFIPFRGEGASKREVQRQATIKLIKHGGGGEWVSVTRTVSKWWQQRAHAYAYEFQPVYGAMSVYVYGFEAVFFFLGRLQVQQQSTSCIKTSWRSIWF